MRLDRKEARRRITAVNKALRDGHRPPGVEPSRKEPNAVTVAAERLGVSRQSFAQVLPSIARHYGLTPNWDLWKPEELPPLPKAPEPAADPLVVRQLRDRLAQAETLRAQAEREAISGAALREGVFKLAATPPTPPDWAGDKAPGAKHREAIVLPISDVHMGEVIDLEQMGGRNSYNRAIAARRLERLFQSVVKLGTSHWHGPPPAVIYVVLLGDLITGEIHDELAKTNDLLSIPAVRELSGLLISGLDLLLQKFACEIRVVSLPGNHGRTTRKPEAKGAAINSYDTLVAWSVESWYRAKGAKRISFSAPASGDALINIAGWRVLFTHGNNIGSRGGMGFIGPAATIARGMQRVIQDYAAVGEIVDYVVTGHFHTPIELEQGFCNGSVPGPSEYSMQGRMRSHPASQWFLTFHPEIGVARRWKIYLGAPDEGSIYKGRAV
ncbi:metallophosphoesterase [Rhodoblastus sp.]|uniref:metallophosphoesterase n=1 Tax=Rhodoblastus sp. TaxID=1962975 RepID=UPI0026395D26|nr:metallophosphoesterase [Rhodoblastus sp.]